MTSSLSPEEFRELERLFNEALLLPQSRRAALLDGLRARSGAMADRLAAMLEEDVAPADPLAEAVSGAALEVADHADPLIGERFGPFRVERVLGRGGMGAVYLGVRADDAFRQQVAIKTIRSGLELPHLLERFRREREILARLDHPGIARLVDGGAGPRNIPFVAMEYVVGVPLMDHVTAGGLGVRERLALFAELCGAIEFVHRNLIVHRDLKPGNVMVTIEGRVKLLDFGIAKLLDEFEGGAAPTATAYRAMTPEYASPEQLLGRPVTTATDIYALGVLLYELLTGQRPIRFDSRNPYALAQAIVERTPSTPSEAVRKGSAAGAPPGAPHRLKRQLSGDLDRIVMMALRKEPSRRYATVSALADDVRRYLDGRPVSAQIDSWHYRLRKFVTRRPVASAAAVLFVAVIAAFLMVTTRQARAIGVQRDRAEAEAATAKASADFLVGLFNVADPRQAGNRTATAYDLLHTGVDRLEGDEKLDPRVKADLELTLGLALANLEEYDEGVRSLRLSIAGRERIYGRDSLETAEAMHRLGDVLRRVNRYDEAYALLTEALDIRRRHIEGESYEIADSYNNLAILAIVMGKYRESEDLQRESIAMHARLTGPGSMERGTPLNNLSLLKGRQGRQTEALDLARRAVAALSTGTDQDAIHLAELQVARLTRDMGSPREAMAELERLRGIYVTLMGPDNSRTLDIERDIGTCLELMGEYDRAAQVFETALARMGEALGEGSMSYARVQMHYGRLEREMGDPAAAERRQRDALEKHLALTGEKYFGVPTVRRELAETLIERGKLGEAADQLRRALAVLPDTSEYPHVERASVLTALGRVLVATDRTDEARASLAEARAIIGETIGEESIEIGKLLVAEAGLLEAEGDASGARRRLEEAEAVLSQRLPSRHPALSWVRSRLDSAGNSLVPGG